MGEIHALAESQGGTMDTNAQAGTWTLNVHLPLGESPPAWMDVSIWPRP